METVYWVTAAFAVATVISMKWGRDARASVALTVITAVLFMFTPAGHTFIGFISETGAKIAGGAK